MKLPLIGRAIAGMHRRPLTAALVAVLFGFCGVQAVRLVPWLLDGSLSPAGESSAARVVGALVVFGIPAFVVLIGLWALGTLAGPPRDADEDQ